MTRCDQFATSNPQDVTSSTYQADGDGSHAAVDDVGGHGDLVCATLADDEAALTLEGFETLSRTRWLYSTVGRWVGRAQRLDHFCGLETKMM